MCNELAIPCRWPRESPNADVKHKHGKFQFNKGFQLATLRCSARHLLNVLLEMKFVACRLSAGTGTGRDLGRAVPLGGHVPADSLVAC